MRNTDQPFEEDLPAFERELAEKIEVCAGRVRDGHMLCPDLARISWKAVCGRILEAVKSAG